MCTPASHFMELIEGKQLLKVIDITHGRTRIPVHGGLSSTLIWKTTNTSSGSLWKEFRNSMSLDGKKITCLFSFQLKLNIFINYECSQPQRYLQYPWILTPIKITVVFLSQFSFCRYLKIAFTYHY